MALSGVHPQRGLRGSNPSLVVGYVQNQREFEVAPPKYTQSQLVPTSKYCQNAPKSRDMNVKFQKKNSGGKPPDPHTGVDLRRLRDLPHTAPT